MSAAARLDGVRELALQQPVLVDVAIDGARFRQVVVRPACDDPAFAPDGTSILLVAGTGGISISNASGEKVSALPLPADASQPAWQPLRAGS